MDPVALSFAAKLLLDGLRALKDKGWEPTDEDMETVRQLRHDAVARWDSLAPGDEE